MLRSVLLVMLVAATPAYAAAPRVTIAVLPPMAEGAAPGDAARLEAALRTAVSSSKRFKVQAAAATKKHVEAGRRFGLSCGIADVECLRKLGVAADVDKVFASSVLASQDGELVSVVLIDVESGAEEQRLTMPYRRDDAAGTARDVVDRALFPERFTSGLDVDVDKPGADVVVDGVSRGRTPLPGPVLGLAEGKHGLTVTLEGYEPYELVVTTRASEIARMKLALTPRKPVVDPTMKDTVQAAQRAAEQMTQAASDAKKPAEDVKRAAEDVKLAAAQTDRNAGDVAAAAEDLKRTAAELKAAAAQQPDVVVVETAADPPAPASPVGNPLFVGGAATAAIAFVGVVGMGAGALVLDYTAGDVSRPPVERDAAVLPGRVLVVGTIVAGAALIAGAALMGAAFVE
jgi:hypothetical protein